MNNLIRKKLIDISKNKLKKRKDPSHDINHSRRVLYLSEKIAKSENADINIVVPSAIFHDIINYPKNHYKRLDSSLESAIFTQKILKNINYFSKDQINKVYESIHLCSFTKGVLPDFLEAKILQDADSLEAMGAVSIMRTFSSAGIMNRSFYKYSDPFCEKRKPDDSNYALDLFYTRLLVVKDRLHTKTAKAIAEKRFLFLKKFINELKYELSCEI